MRDLFSHSCSPLTHFEKTAPQLARVAFESFWHLARDAQIE